MPLWMQRSLAIAIAVAGALWAARSFQARALAEKVTGLEARAHVKPSQARATQSLEGLPDPVRRYLKHALPPDRRALTLVRYEQVGSLRIDPSRDRWVKFTASQLISPTTIEFLWTARASIAPLIHVQVRDSLVEGIGAGRVALFTALPIASAAGGMEMDSGSLHRFLAEAVWYPTALLPSSQLTWRPLDDDRAIATLANGPTTVSLEFRFNPENEVTSIYTPGRWGLFDGTYRRVAWEGKFGRYSRRQGVLVPQEGEVGWYLDGEWRSVWRGEVTSVSMEFQ